jgi:hypothetical protein
VSEPPIDPTTGADLERGLRAALVALDPRGQRLFAAAAIEHALDRFEHYPDSTDVVTLREVARAARALARGELDEPARKAALARARDVVEIVDWVARRANEDELHYFAFLELAEGAVVALSTDERRSDDADDDDDLEANAAPTYREPFSPDLVARAAAHAVAEEARYEAVAASDFTIPDLHDDANAAADAAWLAEREWQVATATSPPD